MVVLEWGFKSSIFLYTRISVSTEVYNIYIVLGDLGDAPHMCYANPSPLSHIPVLSRSYYLERGSGPAARLASQSDRPLRTGPPSASGSHEAGIAGPVSTLYVTPPPLCSVWWIRTPRLRMSHTGRPAKWRFQAERWETISRGTDILTSPPAPAQDAAV